MANAEAVLRAALAYGELGLRSVPLAPDAKHPTQEEWQRKATSDPRKNRARFAHPRNIGLLMGTAEDGRCLFAVDEDPKNGGEGCLKSFLGKRILPDTATALTPSGGTHRLFYAPEGLGVTSRTGDHGLAPGVDVIGEASQIVVEPSAVGGREYVWLRHPKQGIAVAPKWLLELAASPRSEAASPARPASSRPREARKAARAPQAPPGATGGPEAALLADALTRFQVAGKSQRNRLLYRLVSSLACQGFDDATITTVCGNWWDYWHAAGTASDPRDDAQIARQLSCTRRALESGRLSPSGGANHRVAVSRLSLTPRQEDALSLSIIYRGAQARRSGPSGEALQLPPGPGLRRLPPPPLRAQERDGRPFGHLQGDESADSRDHGGPVRRQPHAVQLPEVEEPFRQQAIHGTGGQPGGSPCHEIRAADDGIRGEAGRRVGLPSEYALSETFAEMLDLGTPGEAAPSPSAALPAAVPAEGPPEPESATGAEREPKAGKGEVTMARARELGLGTVEPPATLKFPERKGLVNLVTELIKGGQIPLDGIGEISRAVEDRIAAERRAAESGHT